MTGKILLTTPTDKYPAKNDGYIGGYFQTPSNLESEYDDLVAAVSFYFEVLNTDKSEIMLYHNIPNNPKFSGWLGWEIKLVRHSSGSYYYIYINGPSSSSRVEIEDFKNIPIYTNTKYDFKIVAQRENYNGGKKEFYYLTLNGSTTKSGPHYVYCHNKSAWNYEADKTDFYIGDSNNNIDITGKLYLSGVWNGGGESSRFSKVEINLDKPTSGWTANYAEGYWFYGKPNGGSYTDIPIRATFNNLHFVNAYCTVSESAAIVGKITAGSYISGDWQARTDNHLCSYHYGGEKVTLPAYYDYYNSTNFNGDNIDENSTMFIGWNSDKVTWLSEANTFTMPDEDVDIFSELCVLGQEQESEDKLTLIGKAATSKTSPWAGFESLKVYRAGTLIDTLTPLNLNKTWTETTIGTYTYDIVVTTYNGFYTKKGSWKLKKDQPVKATGGSVWIYIAVKDEHGVVSPKWIKVI